MLALAPLCLLSPFATGALIAASPQARRLAGRHYPLLLTFGLFGLALVVLGAFVLARPLSLVALAVGGPLSGLSFWIRRSGEDDDGDDDPDDPEEPPPGDDWERIVQELERHVERWAPPNTGRRSPSRQPAPAAPSLV